MTTYRRTTLFFVSATLGLAAGLVPLSAASAADVACGDVLTADTVLTADLTCGPTSDALVIGADDVTLNLAGHTITGPGAYATPFAGVRAAQRSGVTIEKGTITGFQSGVVLDESTDGLVTKLAVHHNDQGINLAGIKRILDLQDQVSSLHGQLERVRETLESMTPAQRRVFSADRDGEISALRRGERPRRPSRGNALVVWRPTRRS